MMMSKHKLFVILFLCVFLKNSLTAVEHVRLEASAAEEQSLLYEQSDLRIEVVELTRLAAIKVGRDRERMCQREREREEGKHEHDWPENCSDK